MARELNPHSRWDAASQSYVSTSDPEAWRVLTTGERSYMGREYGRRLSQRMMEGLDKYGPRFVGPPLEEALEEVIDAAAYITVAIKERDHLRDRVQRLENWIILRGMELPEED